LESKKKSSSSSTKDRGARELDLKLEQQYFKQLKLKSVNRKKFAKSRLKLDAHFDKKWLSIRGNHEYYLFDISRTIITRNPNNISITIGNIFKPKMKGKALLYMDELALYGHMCFNDYKTYPAQLLKDMASNIKNIKDTISLVMKKLETQQITEQTKHGIGQKFSFGLASGLPHQYHTVLWEELDTMRIQFEELEEIVKADREFKDRKTKTPFLGKIQYYLFLCKELFKMIDFSKFPEVNTDNYDRYLQGFIVRIIEEIPEISATNKIAILDSIYLRPEEKKKYAINKFVNLMGCNSPKEYEKARKLINF